MKSNLFFGFYFGIGDFISAVPLLRHLAKQQDRYKIYVAISAQNQALVPLLDLKNVEFLTFSLFALTNIKKLFKFIRELKKLPLDTVVVSPHALAHDTSWKIPLLLRYLKLVNHKLTIIGAASDKNSWVYDKRISIDRAIPIMEREIRLAKLAGLVSEAQQVERNNIFQLPSHEPQQRQDYIVIHPGATKAINRWREQQYFLLCKKILQTYPEIVIKFVALPHELEPLKELINLPGVEFFTGTIVDAVASVAQAKLTITVDSGFAHIASALGVPHIAVYGPKDPMYVKPIYPNTRVCYKPVFACQPCNRTFCRMGYNYCMDSVTYEDICSKIEEAIIFVK